MEEKMAEFGNLMLACGLNILAALAIFIIGKWITNKITGLVSSVMQRHKVDLTLAQFTSHLCQAGLMTFVVLAALARLGIQTASFIAVLGAAGLAVGMALQGSLSNFAAGVLVLIFRPYKVGDTITAGGITGTVKEIQIFNTILANADNVQIIMPNSQATGGNIVNYSANSTRRIEIKVGIAYSDDIAKAKQVLMETAVSEKRVLKTPAPEVVVAELGASSVNLAVRCWVNAGDYGPVLALLTERVKLDLEKNGLSLPFPQQDVYIKAMPAAKGAPEKIVS